MKTSALVILTLIILAALVPRPCSAQPLRAFASILPVKHFVEKIGGERVEVTPLVGPGQSPATYEPTPRQLGGLASAALLFRVGVPFEEQWLPRMIAGAPGVRVVDLRQGIDLLTLQEHDHDGHSHGGMEDPHIWTSPLHARRMAATIRDTLAEADPVHRQEYEARYAAFAKELEDLDAWTRTLLAPYKGRSFLVFHPSWGYFAEAYGLRQVAVEVQGKSPGARTLARLLETARAEKVGAIFVQEQFSRHLADALARDLKAQVISIDPLAENYVTNLRQVVEAFAKALEQ